MSTLRPPTPAKLLRQWTLFGGTVLFGAAVALSPLVAQDGPRLVLGEPEATDSPDDAVGEPVGLSLVLPEDVPDAIRPRAWDELPESWADWADETGQRLADLYSGELSADDQRYALERLRVKLGTLEKAIGSSPYAPIKGQLADFRDALKLRVDLAEAVLPSTLNPPAGASDAAVAAEFAKLTKAAVAAANDLSRVQHSELWKQYLRIDELLAISTAADLSDEALDQLDAVYAKLDGDGADDEQEEFLQRESLQDLAEAIDELLYFSEEIPSDAVAYGQRIGELFAAVDEYEQTASAESAAQIQSLLRTLPGQLTDGGRVSSILDRRYRGSNVRAVVGEELIREIMQRSKFERGVVNDCILGARVLGCRVTNSKLVVDLVPSATGAQFGLNLSGTVQTQTNAYKSPARVSSVGNHAFSANKLVRFDGRDFSATPAAVGVNINNRVTNVTTSINFPIIRKIARNMARKEVAKNAPKTAAITRRKVTSNVGSRFNSEVDTLLAEAESNLQSKLYGPLATLGLSPARESISTTDTTANLSWLVAAPDELAASPAPPLPTPSHGIAAQVHESYLNAFLDRMELHGKTLSNTELQAYVRGKIAAAFNRPAPVIESSAGGELSNSKFIFDTEDPVRLRIEDDRIVLLMRTGLKLEDKDDIPTQIVEVPLNISRRGSQVIVQTGKVSVKPAEGGGGFRQIARSKVMIQKIEEAGDGERVFEGRRTLELNDDRQLTLVLQSLDVAAGWITLTME